MSTKTENVKQNKAPARTDYTEADVKRDMQVSGATIFAFSSKMDLRVDNSQPKNGTKKQG